MPPLKTLLLLALAAIGTVCDVAPLTGFNRAIVAQGLKVLRAGQNLGLVALAESAGRKGSASVYDFGFVLGPRINAGGRIGDAALGARLLLTEDPTEAERIAAELDRLNVERRAIELATVEAAQAEADLALGRSGESAAIVVAGEEWSPGIVGLVASRLKERFQRPAFAIALGGKTGVGSGRSIAGVDLGSAVRAAVDAGILIKGGGHAMAAGVTIQRERLGEFRAFLEQKLASRVAAARERDALLVDSAVTAAGASTVAPISGNSDVGGPLSSLTRAAGISMVGTGGASRSPLVSVPTTTEGTSSVRRGESRACVTTVASLFDPTGSEGKNCENTSLMAQQ